MHDISPNFLLLFVVLEVFPDDLIGLKNRNELQVSSKELSVFFRLLILRHYWFRIRKYTLNYSISIRILKNDKNILNLLKPLAFRYFLHSCTLSLLEFLGGCQDFILFLKPFLLLKKVIQLILFVRYLAFFIGSRPKFLVYFVDIYLKVLHLENTLDTSLSIETQGNIDHFAVIDRCFMRV